MSQHDQLKSSIQKFLQWFEKCEGNEKQETQLFFEKLLQAFGNPGVKEVGAHCEYRVSKKEGKGKKFADFVWEPRTVIELKSRGEPLQKHFNQVLEYWNTICPKLKYMVLCNFDEFWIYDPNVQMYDPIHILKTKDLLRDWQALAFLLPKEEKPVFNNNNVAVTEDAAKVVGSLYLSLKKRKVDPEKAQRFVLQLVVSLFAEDVELIPKNTLLKILHEAIKKPVAQKELYELFTAMAEEKESKKPKKYKDIPYFNGGIFTKIEPIEFNFEEISILSDASGFDWSKVRPSIFGSIFESSIDEKQRHGQGIHFTSEVDIQKIVTPTIVRPFQERITIAKTKKELISVLKDIREFRVLDPACGSGNFLYIAFRELRRLEAEVIELIGDEKGKRGKGGFADFSNVSPRNFFGIDKNSFALELAKISLCIGRKLSSDELNLQDNILPFDNLDKNFQNKDALFEAKWPSVNAVIGNPPFLGSRYMAKEFGYDYTKKLHEKFPSIPRMADYCTYWFRLAHDHLSPEGMAGLVGTNTIRQNESREASLDYITENGGTIINAVSTQVWSGDAAVHVSIVNWKKGENKEVKNLYTQLGDRADSPWSKVELKSINSSLSITTDVSSASDLEANQKPKCVYIGQYPFHHGFLLAPDLAKQWIKKDKKYSEILFPYLIGRDLLQVGHPTRWIIDFGQNDLHFAMKYPLAFKHVETLVMPTVIEKAHKEKKATGKASTRWTRMVDRWWQFRDWQPGTMRAIAKIPRYIACSRVTKRPIFEFVSNKIHPDNTVVVFPFSDDYSFGILQSSVHASWFHARCSSMKGDPRYTSETVFDTFPWPQNISLNSVQEIASKAVSLRNLRNKLIETNKLSLRDLYKSLEKPGKNILRERQQELDDAVRSAYGMNQGDITLSFLLNLNQELKNKESLGEKVVGPGLPPCVKEPKSYMTKDCVDSYY